MSISVSTSKQQITATVVDDKITATVSGGVGPTGPQGAPGATDYGQLTNVPAEFNPASHAARHAAAGGDPVTIIAAQVSDFTSAVVAAAPPTTNASLLVSGTLDAARLPATVVFTTDARLSDSREWSAATVSQADAEAGSSTGRFAFTPQRIFQAVAAWWAGSSAKTKLDGIASGATANQTDAYLLSRANHTGTQLASTISDFTTAVIAAAPPTTNASLLTSGTLPDARLSANIARTSDVSSAVAALVNSSPAALDTLGELATALGNDASFSTTVTNALAAKAPIASPTFTGTVSGVTKTMVGLGNVDNTSDASKPVSTAQAAADSAVASAAASDATTKANAAQAAAVQRANHTGTQAASTITGLATVATSGSYNDLTSKPTTLSGYGITDAAAAIHTHTASSITDFSSAVAAASPEEVVEYTTTALFPASGNSTLLYIATDASRAYRWTGAAYVEVGPLASYVTPVSASSVSGLASVATSGSASDLTGTLSASRLPASGVTAGTYTSISVDATGRVTAGTNPSGGVKLGLILALQ